jgi:hypothetical protein
MTIGKTLTTGPYAGEFGWELFSWQAYIRRLSKQYEKTIVCAPSGHDALYADFASEYIPFDAAVGIRDCWWLANADVVVKKKQEELRSLGSKLIIPVSAIKICDQDFIKFGTPGVEPAFDILLHAREPIGRRPQHSWQLDNWNRLCIRLSERGLRLACIGTEAFGVRGTVDRRNIPMKQLMNLMASATLVIGPSSGPMHLASLCGTPHFVWTDNAVYQAIGANNRRRYQELWNPLRTPCKVFDSYGWNPPVNEVADAVLAYFFKLKESR